MSRTAIDDPLLDEEQETRRAPKAKRKKKGEGLESLIFDLAQVLDTSGKKAKSASEMLRLWKDRLTREKNSEQALLQLYAGTRSTLKLKDSLGTIPLNDRERLVEFGWLPKQKKG